MINSEKVPETFCIVPWVQLAINSTGYLRLCCNSTPGKNIILDDNNQKIHINRLENINSLKDNTWLNSVRSSMLKGESISICERCYREEKANVKSSRQGWNHKFSNHIDAALKQTSNQGATEYYKAEYIDLRLGNLCNLKCRMCNPYASKKWLEDWNSIQEEELPESEISRLSKVNWFKNPMTWDLLSQLSESTREIYFTGGEPFLILEHKKLIRYLSDQNYSKKIKLKYNTNLTVLPEQITQEWCNFKKVTVNVSIDGIGLINNYIRNPSEWTHIESNLKKLQQLVRDQPNIVVNIHSTVQIYNINKVIEIFDYLKDYDEFNRVPYVNILNHPSYLNIRTLPLKNKLQIEKELEEWVRNNKNYYIKSDEVINLKKIEALSKYMIKEDWSHHQDAFRDYTRKLDVRRNEKLSTVNPFIAEVMQLF